MFPMTVTINNLTEFDALMVALGVGKKKTAAKKVEEQGAVTSGATDQVEVSANNTTRSETAPSSAADAAADVKPAAETTAIVEAAEQSVEAAAGVTYEQAAKAVTELAKAKGRDAAVAVLDLFGAKKLPDVKPEHYADLMTACAGAA
jgi:hypothetical protein